MRCQNFGGKKIVVYPFFWIPKKRIKYKKRTKYKKNLESKKKGIHFFLESKKKRKTTFFVFLFFVLYPFFCTLSFFFVFCPFFWSKKKGYTTIFFRQNFDIAFTQQTVDKLSVWCLEWCLLTHLSSLKPLIASKTK